MAVTSSPIPEANEFLTTATNPRNNNEAWDNLQTIYTFSDDNRDREGGHLRESGLHVQLLEDCVHVTSGTTVPQPHKPWTGSAVHGGKVLERQEHKRGRRMSALPQHTSTQPLRMTGRETTHSGLSIQQGGNRTNRTYVRSSSTCVRCCGDKTQWS